MIGVALAAVLALSPQKAGELAGGAYIVGLCWPYLDSVEMTASYKTYPEPLRDIVTQAYDQGRKDWFKYKPSGKHCEARLGRFLERVEALDRKEADAVSQRISKVGR